MRALHRRVVARFARETGADAASAEPLLRTARARAGNRTYALVAGAFLIAAHPVAPWALPRRLRARGIAALTGRALRDPADLCDLVGSPAGEEPCRGLRVA